MPPAKKAPTVMIVRQIVEATHLKNLFMSLTAIIRYECGLSRRNLCFVFFPFLIFK